MSFPEIFHPAGAPSQHEFQPAPGVTLMLVSQEVMPNYLGFVHEPTAEVLLVVTPKMAARADALDALLAAAPHPPQRIARASFADDADFATQCLQAQDLLAQLRQADPQPIILNLTGGTKPMSVAFLEAARALQREGAAVHTAYVDTQNARLDSFDSPSSPPRPMLGAVDVRAAVLASGKADAGCGSASKLMRNYMQRGPLHAQLLALPGDLIGKLNILAVLASGDKLSQTHWLDTAQPGLDGVQILHRGSADHGDFDRLARTLLGPLGALLTAHGVMREAPRVERDGAVRLAWRTPGEIDYLKGGWLEAHVAALIAVAAPDDWAADVQIGQDGDTGRNNEIDAIVTCGNRTLLIEVKTANLDRKTSADDGSKSNKAQDALFKLDSIGHDLARYFSANWLVSARALSNAGRQRADDKRIRLFAPAHNGTASAALREFEDALRKWVQDARTSKMQRLDAAFRPLRVSTNWRRKEQQDAAVYAAATPETQAPAPTALAAAFARAHSADSAAPATGTPPQPTTTP